MYFGLRSLVVLRTLCISIMKNCHLLKPSIFLVNQKIVVKNMYPASPQANALTVIHEA